MENEHIWFSSCWNIDVYHWVIHSASFVFVKSTEFKVDLSQGQKYLLWFLIEWVWDLVFVTIIYTPGEEAIKYLKFYFKVFLCRNILIDAHACAAVSKCIESTGQKQPIKWVDFTETLDLIGTQGKDI